MSLQDNQVRPIQPPSTSGAARSTPRATPSVSDPVGRADGVVRADAADPLTAERRPGGTNKGASSTRPGAGPPAASATTIALPAYFGRGGIPQDPNATWDVDELALDQALRGSSHAASPALPNAPTAAGDPSHPAPPKSAEQAASDMVSEGCGCSGGACDADERDSLAPDLNVVVPSNTHHARSGSAKPR